jgi:hypothetical protein
LGTTKLGIDLALQEGNSLGRGSVPSVDKVTSIDIEGSTADAVVLIAVDGDLILGIVWYLAPILLVSGVSKQDAANHSGLDIRRKSADRIVHDGSSLAVGNVSQVKLDLVVGNLRIAAKDHNGLRAFGRSRGEHSGSLSDGTFGGSLGTDVVRKSSRVWWPNSLACHSLLAVFLP